MNNEKIKNKIKALLSKTVENGATKQEMESALRKANELMIQHFISESEIKDESLKEKLVSKRFNMIKSKYDFKIFYASLSLLFDCKCYYNSQAKKITFFGHETDVDMCGYFYSLITESAIKEKNEYAKSNEYSISKKLGYHGKTLTSSFVKGFLIEVSNKMREMYKDKKSNIEKGTGLTVYEKKNKVESAFRNLNLNLIKVKNKIRAESNAFDSGKSKGQNFNLTQGINKGKTETITKIG